mgnify:FL=1
MMCEFDFHQPVSWFFVHFVLSCHIRFDSKPSIHCSCFTPNGPLSFARLYRERCVLRSARDHNKCNVNSTEIDIFSGDHCMRSFKGL